MRKVFLGLLCIFVLNISYVFAYFSSTTFIDFLVHEDQLRIRTDRMGFLAGTENIRASVGVTGADILSGIILENINNSTKIDDVIMRLVPSVMGAIGYYNDSFAAGVGYEFSYKTDAYMIHTPALTMTALDNSFRINIPVSIGVGSASKHSPTELMGTMVVSTAAEARYYFNDVPFLNHLRFYVNYGYAHLENVFEPSQYLDQQSMGFQLRVYFKIETPNVSIEPIIRVQYDAALETKYVNGFQGHNVAAINDNFSITARDFTPYLPIAGPGSSGGAQGNPTLGAGLQGGYVASVPSPYYAIEPYRLGISLPVGFRAANADKSIDFYLEPALSYTLIDAKELWANSGQTIMRDEPFHIFGYVVYGELSIRPVPELEWYLEVQTGGATIPYNASGFKDTTLVFNGATGLSWYF